jgi:hypothetical protein
MTTRKLTKTELNFIPLIEELFNSDKMTEVDHLNRYGGIDISATKKIMETNISDITIVRLVKLPVFYISFTVFGDTISFAFDSKEISEKTNNSFNDFIAILNDI